MQRIYSRTSPGTLLHVVHRLSDISERRNIVSDEEFLQVAAMRLSEGQTFRPHKHVLIEKTTTITQESWVVIAGSVKCILYDLDDTIIAEEVLMPGDCSITLRGGHNYVSLSPATLVYEYKTGPYLGTQQDKTFI